MARERQTTPGPAPPAARAPRASAPVSAVLRLQRAAGNRAVGSLLARETKAPAAEKKKPKKPPKVTSRKTALEAMTWEFEIPDPRRAVIAEALKAFSDRQVVRLGAAGVRFWGPKGLPPGYHGVVVAPEMSDDSSAHGGVRASWTPGARIIRLPGPTSKHHIIHELVHAWDNIRGVKTKSMHDLIHGKNPNVAVMNEANATANYAWSESKTKNAVTVNKKRLSLTVAEMLKLSRDRGQLRDQQFGTPGTAAGYSKTSVAEFYAEAFAVYYAGDTEQRERLKVESPEMFDLLKRDR